MGRLEHQLVVARAARNLLVKVERTAVAVRGKENAAAIGSPNRAHVRGRVERKSRRRAARQIEQPNVRPLLVGPPVRDSPPVGRLEGFGELTRRYHWAERLARAVEPARLGLRLAPIR